MLLPPTMDFVFKGLFGNGFPGVRGIARTFSPLLGLGSPAINSKIFKFKKEIAPLMRILK